jgi:ribosomal protein L7/L12
MTTETEIIALRSRVAELEDRLQYLYKYLRIEYSDNPNPANQKVVEALRQGGKIEAIKVYREIYNVGLAEAKQAVESIEASLGL